MSWLADREEFIFLMAREGLSLENTRTILRAANTLQRLASEACGRELTERELGAVDRLERKIGELTLAMCWPAPILGGDPRGCVVKLAVASGFTNDWGKEGICVPTRRW